MTTCSVPRHGAIRQSEGGSLVMGDGGRSDGGPVASFVALCSALPGQARLDALPLHQVTVRGIERCALFRHDDDQVDLIAGLAHLAEPGASIVDA